MAGPKDLSAVRSPVVAGTFYPADPRQCRTMAHSMLHVNREATSGTKWIGGIVPHAGWICSGAVAGETIATLAESTRPSNRDVDVVVVFGAIHTPLHTDIAALDAHRLWRVPGEESQISQELSAKLIENSSAFAIDERFHRREHAVEVELPLIQLAWPGASVLPVEVPVLDEAVEIGRRTAEQIERAGLNAVYLASSDLTHYGPNYDFTPVGIGIEAVQWAKENDQRLLQVVTDMRFESVVPHVRVHMNACGGGAIAAMMAACRHHGAANAHVLRHTCSFETLADVAPQPPENSVGYASVLVG